MTNKGYPVMMLGCAMNHGPGCYRVFNPKTNRIVITRDVVWSDFNPKTLIEDFTVFEPGVENLSLDLNAKQNGSWLPSHSNTNHDDSTISSDKNSTSYTDDTFQADDKHENHKSITSMSNDSSDESSIEDGSISSKGGDDTDSSNSSSSNNDSSSISDSPNHKSPSATASNISKPVATRTRSTFKVQNPRHSRVPVPVITTRVPKGRSKKSTASVKSTRTRSSMKLRSGKVVKKVTGNIVASKVRIFTPQDEGEDEIVNLVEPNQDESDDVNLVQLNDESIDHLYNGMEKDDEIFFNLFTMELVSDQETPKTITQALSGADAELWRKSAIAEVNNFI